MLQEQSHPFMLSSLLLVSVFAHFNLHKAFKAMLLKPLNFFKLVISRLSAAKMKYSSAYEQTTKLCGSSLSGYYPLAPSNQSALWQDPECVCRIHHLLQGLKLLQQIWEHFWLCLLSRFFLSDLPGLHHIRPEQPQHLLQDPQVSLLS